MYTPKVFEVSESKRLAELIRANPFATLISQSPYLHINHLPLICEGEVGEENFTLLGHMAKSNPQWHGLAKGEVVAIFHGPHSYITPRWYVNPLNVPTWNYVVVHVTGRAKVISDEEGIERILKKSVDQIESGSRQPWRYELPEEFKGKLIAGVIGFEISVTKIEGKFKLSQNRSAQDRAGVERGLSARTDEMSQKVLELMRKSRVG